MRSSAMPEDLLTQHLKAAAAALRFETERPDGTAGPDISLAEELERIDAALGPKGGTLLFAIAQAVREAEASLADALRLLERAQ
jgi:hypothetical protein